MLAAAAAEVVAAAPAVAPEAACCWSSGASAWRVGSRPGFQLRQVGSALSPARDSPHSSEAEIAKALELGRLHRTAPLLALAALVRAASALALELASLGRAAQSLARAAAAPRRGRARRRRRRLPPACGGRPCIDVRCGSRRRRGSRRGAGTKSCRSWSAGTPAGGTHGWRRTPARGGGWAAVAGMIRRVGLPDP